MSNVLVVRVMYFGQDWSQQVEMSLVEGPHSKQS